MAGKRRGHKNKKRPGVISTDLSKRYKNNATTTMVGPLEPVDDHSFDRVVAESWIPVLVDFWAPWCGPCKAIAPLLEELAREKRGQLRVVKYNTEASSNVASRLGVRSIPTLVLFREGEVAGIKVGAVSKSALSQWIEQTLHPDQGLLG